MTRLTLPGALLLALTAAGDLSAQATPPGRSEPAATSSPAATAPDRWSSGKPGRLLSPAGRSAVVVPAVSLPYFGTGPSAAAPDARPASAAAAGAPASAPAGSLRDSIVALARAQLGTRYVFGGTSPERGFDCSGLIRYIAQALGLDVPRTATEQSRVGLTVARDPSQLRPGDLLTFGNGSRISHIGIYVGDGKFIHASTGARRVVEARLDRKPARGIKPWLGVRRLVADADSAARGG